MEKDRIFWNKHYAAHMRAELGAPEPYLVKHLGIFKPGTVLDLGCGVGRNAIFLAERAFTVTGVDISDLALHRLKHFADERKLIVGRRVLDLDDDAALGSFMKFDNLILNHVCPGIALRKRIPSLLSPGGGLMVCAFNLRQHEIFGVPKEDCLAPRELEAVFTDLELLNYDSFKDKGWHFDGYLFRKPVTEAGS